MFFSSGVFSFYHLPSNSHLDSPKMAHSVDSSPAEYPSLQSPRFCPRKQIVSEKRVASHTVSLRRMNHGFGCGTVCSRKIVGGRGLNLGLTVGLTKVEKNIEKVVFTENGHSNSCNSSSRQSWFSGACSSLCNCSWCWLGYECDCARRGRRALTTLRWGRAIYWDRRCGWGSCRRKCQGGLGIFVSCRHLTIILKPTGSLVLENLIEDAEIIVREIVDWRGNVWRNCQPFWPNV